MQVKCSPPVACRSVLWLWVWDVLQRGLFSRRLHWIVDYFLSEVVIASDFYTLACRWPSSVQMQSCQLFKYIVLLRQSPQRNCSPMLEPSDGLTEVMYRGIGLIYDVSLSAPSGLGLHLRRTSSDIAELTWYHKRQHECNDDRLLKQLRLLL
ncbi:hypothetical protein BDV26DRAFT_70386 [Aspergillus bertholletiae]|uniref:Uncharacterized protein n=1 Tax=Aspergillus bertholletiae TaxID=1226010 RepID=A0A5N7AWR9_9EURO|nr:hypothetical protein BDV26DRAFT_70386 [Aspergillus bertholletiae]